jgi:hypothetical protein
MIHRYRRQARAHEELGLGALLPLVAVVPEFKALAVADGRRRGVDGEIDS